MKPVDFVRPTDFIKNDIILINALEFCNVWFIEIILHKFIIGWWHVLNISDKEPVYNTPPSTILDVVNFQKFYWHIYRHA